MQFLGGIMFNVVCSQFFLTFQHLYTHHFSGLSGSRLQCLAFNCCVVCFPLQAEPIRVLVTGAAGQIAYSLLFSIAKGDVFGKDQVKKKKKVQLDTILSLLLIRFILCSSRN